MYPTPARVRVFAVFFVKSILTFEENESQLTTPLMLPPSAFIVRCPLLGMQINALKRNEHSDVKKSKETENAPINIFLNLVSSETEHPVDVFHSIGLTTQRQIRQGHKERRDILYWISCIERSGRA